MIKIISEIGINHNGNLNQAISPFVLPGINYNDPNFVWFNIS